MSSKSKKCIPCATRNDRCINKHPKFVKLSTNRRALRRENLNLKVKLKKVLTLSIICSGVLAMNVQCD